MLGYHGYYTYYIHWASKFATSANIGNTAAYKRRSKTSPELKPLQKSSRNNILGVHHVGKTLSKLSLVRCLNPPALAVAEENMHLNSAGTSSVLQLPIAAHLIDVFQLEVEIQEDELIRTASSKSLCQQ